MNIGIISTYDNIGGAGKAATRLHIALNKNTPQVSAMYVMHESSGDRFVKSDSGRVAKFINTLRPDIDRLPLLFYKNRQPTFFSPGLLNKKSAIEFTKDVDVVNIHWIGSGFLGFRSLMTIEKPIVLTLHDSWAFTGGCHVLGDCENYITGCGKCPQLGSSLKYDLSRYCFNEKLGIRAKDITVVADGNWMAERAKLSPIMQGLDIRVINPGLDLQLFKPHNKFLCRELLGLSGDSKIIMFGAMNATSDGNKGYNKLMSALDILRFKYSDSSGVEIVIFGASRPLIEPNYGFKTHYLNMLRDDLSLSIAYGAADVMVVPSIQEAFGQTASESLACGTPVVAFGATGLLDSVRHMENGFLASPYDAQSLADGISWVLDDEKRYKVLSINARKTAELLFDNDTYAASYLKIYQEKIQR